MSAPGARGRKSTRRRSATPASRSDRFEGWWLEPSDGPLQQRGGHGFGSGVVNIGRRPYRAAIRMLGLGVILERRRWKQHRAKSHPKPQD